MSLLDHQELSICKGVVPTPSDTASAEQSLTVVDLLTSGSAFGLQDWSPNIPSLKSGGVWADSPLTDGRQLIAGTNTNVIETMVVTLTGSTIADYATQFAKLQQLIQDIRDFWDTYYQSNPVFLRWWANNAPGPQFALIYNIDLDIDFNDSNLAQSTITMKIERECFWRGLAPGDNPKRWAVERYFTGQSWSTANCALYTGSDHIGYGVIDNCQEFLTNSSFQSRNFIDIPANAIPGDAPPLLCIVVTDALGNGCKHIIGVNANRTSITDRSGASLLLYNSIPLSSCTIASGTAVFTTDTARGIAHVPASPLKRTVVVTPAGATEVIVATWNVTNFPHFNMLVLKGKYAVFLRASQIGGTAGAVTSRLTMNNTAGTVFDSGLVQVGDDATSGNEINYMGIVEFPPTVDQNVSIDGRGWSVETDIGSISLSTLRASGAGTIRLIDIIFMPLGNYAYINRTVTAGVNPINIYDDTGYFGHGKPDPLMMGRNFAGGTDTLQLTQGAGHLQLTPGVNNRLYFLEYGSSVGAQANLDMTVRANIIPRWSGIRTV